MICPYCKQEMKKGFIQSPRQIFWGEKKHKTFFIPSEEGEFAISKGVFTGSTAEADYCSNCEKIIIEEIA